MSTTHTVVHTQTIRSDESCRAAKILDAATKEFDKCGFSGASVSLIASRAGTSRSLVSYYFPTKSSMASTIVSLAYPGGVFMGMNRETSDPLKAIIQAAEHVTTCVAHNPLARVALKLQNRQEAQLERAPEKYAGWLARVADYLEEARREGLIPIDTDARMQARLLVAGVVGVVNLAFTAGNFLSLIDDSIVLTSERIALLRTGRC